MADTLDDSTSWPYRALLIRGLASIEFLEDAAPEYAQAAAVSRALAAAASGQEPPAT